MAYFDFHVRAGASAVSTIPKLLNGALLFDAAAADQSREFQRLKPGGCWIHAGVLKHLVGSTDSRFPQTKPAVITLDLSGDELLARLREPVESWWPLMNSLRESKTILRLLVPPGSRAMVGVRHLAQNFPQTRLLVDSFIHGPKGGWQGHVRLAELENIWLTTLGMLPLSNHWTDRKEIAEAMYFLVGEVGAGKLLLASGYTLDELHKTKDSTSNPEKWLTEIETLDEDQRTLIKRINAAEMLDFGTDQSE